MAKKKLVPEYQFTLGVESKIEQSTIKNIFDSITDAEKSIYGRINGVRLAQNNNAITFADIARNFVRKNTDDIITAEHAYTRGIRSNNYAAGMGGIGYRLHQDEKGKSHLEIDNINVREAIHTTLLTYDKVNAIGGTMVLSSAWATIDRVEHIGNDEAHRIRCFYKPEGLNVQSWVVGDQVRLQNGLDKFLLTIVTNVSTTHDSEGYFWVELYHGENYAGGLIAGSTIPNQGDIIVQWGHRGAVPERQNIIIMSIGKHGEKFPYIEQYVGVDTFNTAGKLVARISNDVYFGQADKSKYIWWNKDGNGEMMIKGILNVSPSNVTFPVTTFRGAYDGNTMYYYGDIVVWQGASYVMISKTPVMGNTPSVGVTWDIFASGGATGDVGQSIRYTAWTAGVHYFAGNRNDGGTNNNPSRIVDYVTHIGSDNIIRAYKCIAYHLAIAWNSPDNDEYLLWEQVSYIPALATEIILAKSARIGGFIFSPAIDTNGSAVPMTQQEMRTENDAIRFKGDGSGHLASGNISWDTIGNLFMKGVMEAFAGRIGGLNIYDNTLSSPTMSFSESALETLNTLLTPVTVNFNRVSSWSASGAYHAHAFTQSIVLQVDSVVSFRLDTTATTLINNGARFEIRNILGQIVYTHIELGLFVNDVRSIALPAGTYTLNLYQSSGDTQHVIPMATADISGVSNVDIITAISHVARTKIGNDGFYSFWQPNNYLYYSNQSGLMYKGNSDIPGVLATGSISSGGNHVNMWGAKTSNSAITKGGTGIYNVPHNVGSGNFTVLITPVTDNVNARVTQKNSNMFQVTIRNMAGNLVDAQFDYVLFGAN